MPTMPVVFGRLGLPCDDRRDAITHSCTLTDAEAGVTDAEAGVTDAEAGVTDAEAGVTDAEAGVTCAEAGVTGAAGSGMYAAI